MPYTDEQWNQLHALLKEEQQEIFHRLKETDSYGLDRAMNDSIGELSGYDNHPADIASELFERSKDLALRKTDSNRLREVDRALERMETGEYGVCVRCGGEIPLERLEADPAAGNCIECQKEMEQHDEMKRPVEEFFLYPGFERTNLDGDDQTAYDGEDAWQDVAQYETAMDSTMIIPRGDNYNIWNTDKDDRRGYVEDIEGFLVADLEGNPIDPTPYIVNDAYKRAARDGWVEDYGEETDGFMP